MFLGSAFTIMLVYVWSRRNPYVRMNFFGMMNFQAPYLPWVLLGFSLLLGNSVIVDLMGKCGISLKKHNKTTQFILNVCNILLFCVFCTVQSVGFCTGHFCHGALELDSIYLVLNMFSLNISLILSVITAVKSVKYLQFSQIFSLKKVISNYS